MKLCAHTWHSYKNGKGTRLACPKQAIRESEFCEDHDPTLKAEREKELAACERAVVEAAVNLDEKIAAHYDARGDSTMLKTEAECLKAENGLRSAVAAYREAKRRA